MHYNTRWMLLSPQLRRRDALKIALGLAAAGFRTAKADESVSRVEISSDAGLRVHVTSAGYYEVSAPEYGWTFAGDLGRAAANVNISDGSDAVGNWHEITFEYDPVRTSAIRLYDERPVVLFSTTYGQDSDNNDPFPRFSTFPQGLSKFSYGGLWSYSFGVLNSGSGSPWLLFDGQSNALLLSAASNFMTAAKRVASDGAIEARIDTRIAALPAGFTHRALLVLGHGINRVFDTWGLTLTDLAGKKRPANDAIALLEKLSYWTDAGTAYYYRPQDPTKYVPTLQQMPAEFQRLSIPIGSMELDSWYYPKGSPPSWAFNGSGMDTYRADAAVFPNGLADFQKNLKLPLISHARWVDANAPIGKIYKMSGNVCIDAQYWRDYAQYMVDSGIDVLEQDWLADKAATDFNLTDPYAFLDNMAAAMQAAGRKLVYCMPLWRDILQSVNYDNVLAVRVSNDGFRRERWDELLFNQRIASAVGLWPFADAFNSANVKDVCLATLTAGPLGAGDPIGAIDDTSIKRAVRSDGVIVKPDVPIVPTDATYVAISNTASSPVIASTYTDHDGLRTSYVFAYYRMPNGMSPIAFSPESIGVAGPAYVFDYFNRTGVVVEAGSTFTDTVDYTGSYYLVAPVAASGIAFLGDAGKFVACGKKRIEQISEQGTTVRVRVRFAAGEKYVALRLYSAGRPAVAAESGSMGRLVREGGGLYRVAVSPDASGAATVIFSSSAAPA